MRLLCKAPSPLLRGLHTCSQIKQQWYITSKDKGKPGLLPLCQEAVCLWNRCICRHVILVALYCLGLQNTLQMTPDESCSGATRGPGIKPEHYGCHPRKGNSCKQKCLQHVTTSNTSFPSDTSLILWAPVLMFLFLPIHEWGLFLTLCLWLSNTSHPLFSLHCSIPVPVSWRANSTGLLPTLFIIPFVAVTDHSLHPITPWYPKLGENWNRMQAGLNETAFCSAKHLASLLETLS